MLLSQITGLHKHYSSFYILHTVCIAQNTYNLRHSILFTSLVRALVSSSSNCLINTPSITSAIDIIDPVCYSHTFSPRTL